MPDKVFGGFPTYGQLAGILMFDSASPRLPGDPGHAGTFPFPVRYEVVKGYPFEELVDIRRDHLSLIIDAARALENAGVSFVAADCGLFAPFQLDIAAALNIPFIGSALSLIPLISTLLPPAQKIGLITGDTRLLKNAHLRAAGADPERVVISGMETCPEFKRVVLQRAADIDPADMREGVLAAARQLTRCESHLGAVILECTNLVTFRADIQQQTGRPVYDAVSLIEFFADGYQRRNFDSPYITGR